MAWRVSLKAKGYSRITGELFGLDNAPHHDEWYQILEDKSLRQIVLAAPRGHTKTSCFSVNYPLIRIAEDRNVRILLVSNVASQSQSFLREIVGHIERDEEYIEYAGNLKPKSPEKWTSTEIIVDRDRYDLKDPTISTVGAGGTILSKRADEIIIDDLLNFENSRTLEQRIKLKEWFFQVLLPVLAPGGRLIIVGTVWHLQDLLMEFLADPMFDYHKKFQAVISHPVNKDMWDHWYSLRMIGTPESKQAAKDYLKENREKMHEGVKVLWEKFFPYEKLYTLDRMNHVGFEKAYQNNIVSREDQKFKEEWLIRAMERGANMRLVRSLSPDQRKEYKAVTGGIDLAASEKTTADDNVNLVLGQRRLDDMITILSLDRGRYSPKEFRQIIAERATGLKPDRILVETNGYQNALKRDLVDYNLPIVGFNTGGEKFDPYIGVESLAIMFENDRIILPYDKTDPYTIQMIDALVDELRVFPIGHTGDSAMALWFAYTALRDIMTVSTDDGFLQMVKEDIASQEKQAPTYNWAGMAVHGTDVHNLL